MKVKLTQEETVDFCKDFAARKPASRNELADEYRNAKLGFTVTIEPNKTERTMSQRNYFHLWCRKAAPELDYLSWENLKEDLKDMILGSDQVITKVGTMERRIKSSEDAPRGDYSKLIEKLIFVAAEYGNFVIPEPEKEREEK